jgi:NADH-quinone oxidoreductase subunit C
MENITKKKLQEKFPDSILEIVEFRGELTFFLKKEDLIEICVFLKSDPELKYNFLSDVCGVDFPERDKRFEVVYNLYSIPNSFRIRLKIRVGEDEPVPSVTPIWSGANWMEREVYDMLGIRFDNHPDLRRILLPDDWVGYPLRKDFPLTREEITFSHNKNKKPKIRE